MTPRGDGFVHGNRKGVTFDGGSRDGQDLPIFPATATLSLAHAIAGEEIVELYERTDESRRDRTVYRHVRRQRELED